VRLTDKALGNIQGIITSGYGHLPQAAYVFIKLTEPGHARRWLERVSPSVTPSSRWPVDRNTAKAKPQAAVNLGFTAEGLRALGLPSRVLCTFPLEFQDGIASAARSRILGDTGASAPEHWEVGGSRTDAIHAVLLLFASDEARLDELVSTQRSMLAAAGGVVEVRDSMQRGYRPETASEPFGFHDGIAQPTIAGIEGHGVPTGEFILGYENHYGLIPPTPVVPRDMDPSGLLPRLANPYHASEPLADLGHDGSFLVYRKLQQDVAGFWRFMTQEAARAGRADATGAIWIASKCVGRWPSGAPLALAPEHDDLTLSEMDAFFYSDDPDGLRCPIGAHIRRTNPRDALKPYPPQQSLSMSDAHRLIRRGRVFGPPLVDAALRRLASGGDARALLDLQDDGRARGVHFFCINANLKSQFEFVQQTWANNPRFGGLNDNMDPLASSPCADDTPSRMTIPQRRGELRTHPLPNFVTVKGGAYLFLPSLAALRFLSAHQERGLSGPP
jgi:Dyp-type peroxidase family